MYRKISIDAADKLFSQYVRLRDMECKRCFSKVRLNDKGMPISHQASHFVGRRKEGTRYEPYNVDCLCGACHMYFTAHPAEHYQWQLAKKGQKIIDQLILQSNTYRKKDRKLEALYWAQELKRMGWTKI